MVDRDLQDPEKRMRRRSRTVSWDHSVRSGGGGGTSAASWVRATNDGSLTLQVRRNGILMMHAHGDARRCL